MVTLRWKCSSGLPTLQAVQMAREALSHGFVLPETVFYAAIDSEVRSLAFLLMAYGLVSEPRESDTVITKHKRASVTATGKTRAASDRRTKLGPPWDYGANTGFSDTLAITAAERATVET